MNRGINMAEKKSIFRKLKDANLKNIKSIYDLPDEIQTDIINSVLDAPCIPLSFEQIKNAHSDNIKIVKDGKEVDFDSLKEMELKEQQAFTPRFFMNLVLNDRKYLTPTLSQININNIMALAFDHLVLRPDDPESIEFRAKCEVKYNDMLKFAEEREKKQKAENKSDEVKA